MARQDRQQRRRADRVLPGRPLAIGELRRTLDELDAFLRAEHPDLHGRFRPGLGERELGELAAQLEPYFLPAELVELYRWHDGWEASRGDSHALLFPDAGFLGLSEALQSYRRWLDVLGTDGWHPLWFPAFGTQSGELVVLQPEPGRPAGQVYSFHAELGLETSYDSVGTLFAATLECWRAGLLPPRGLYFFTPELRRLLARHNPGSQTPDGVRRREISRFATRDWPDWWREAIGIVPVAPAPDDLVVTIEELLANPACGRPVRATTRGWGGTFDHYVVTASDGTAEVKVLVDRGETEGARELEGAQTFELWLEPIRDSFAVDRLAEQTSGTAELPPVEFAAKRVVPLYATSAQSP